MLTHYKSLQMCLSHTFLFTHLCKIDTVIGGTVPAEMKVPYRDTVSQSMRGLKCTPRDFILREENGFLRMGDVN